MQSAESFFTLFAARLTAIACMRSAGSALSMLHGPGASVYVRRLAEQKAL
jgi:hypothetical protein